MSKPLAVLISDVHYNLNTLELADAAMRQAIAKANMLKVPIFVLGDLHDTKANLRGECISAMLKTFNLVETECFILVGNHDLINEKSSNNSLEFLDCLNDKVWLVRKHMQTMYTGIDCIAYHSDPDELRALLKTLDNRRILLIHQGIQGSNSGDYIQDKSAISKDDVADFRVISGHYHARQDIKCGRPQKGAVGLFSYVGNPYTLNFAEANDPEKGFQILMDDGLLEFVSTDLRKHIVAEYDAKDLRGSNKIKRPNKTHRDDLLWLKVKGTKEELSNLSRVYIADRFTWSGGFKLELIPTDKKQEAINSKPSSKVEQLDGLIEQSDTSTECKERLKQLWRDYERN